MKKKIILAAAGCAMVLVLGATAVRAVEVGVQRNPEVLEARALGIKKFFKRTADSFKGLFGSGGGKPAPLPVPVPQPVSQPTALPVVSSSPEVAPTGPQVPVSAPAPEARPGTNFQPVRSGHRIPSTGSGQVPVERGSGGASTVFDGSNGAAGKTGGDGPMTGGGIGASAAPKSTSVEPTKLVIETKSALQGLKEDDVVQFTAIVAMNNGTKRDVTAQSNWKVLGFIGSMGTPGVFKAKLDDSVSELGESNGSVVATWKDPSSGKTFLGNTPIFKVEMKIIDNTDNESGSLYKSGLRERIIKFFNSLRLRK